MAITLHHGISRSLGAGLLLIVGMAFGAAASAQGITGQLDFGGTWEPIDADNNATSPQDATGIRFLEEEYPVTLALGVFSHLAGQHVAIETPQFQFTGPFPFTLWSADGGSIHFDLDAVSVTFRSDDMLNIRGDGRAFMDGSEVDGRYLFTGQGVLAFSFSSSTVVPEPATLALFGLGLLGFVWVRHRGV
jgi:hypothetical protein